MKRLSMHFFPRPVHLLAAFCTAFALCAATPVKAQTFPAHPQPRISAPIDSSARVTLASSRPPRAAAADDLGAVPSSLQLHGISLLFSRSAAQQAALDALVAAQQNPASSLYHQWITPDQYAAQFGVADSDIAAAESWLEQQGFSIDSVSRSHNRILFSGTAAQVASAFGAPLHYYLAPATALQAAQKHFAPSADLTLPSALASSVLAIGNLSDFHLVPHILRAPQAAQPRFTSSVKGAHYLTPGDLATIYDITPAYNSGYTGSNQSIAVIGQSAINLSDITNFQNAVGIAGKIPIVKLVPDTGISAPLADGDEAESDLDLEYSSTIAKGAQVYFVYTGNNKNFGAFDAIVYAIDNLVAPVISSSYGDCEPNLGQAQYTSFNASLEQAAAQGQTVVSAAGDNGSTDCYGEYKNNLAENQQLAVDFPASSQYVTGVGGTEFPAAAVAAGNNTYFEAQASTDAISSAKSYIPEMVWNDDVAATADSCAPSDPASECSPTAAGGGGVSIFTIQPAWQAGTVGGVAIASPGHRMVPDIALTASPYNAPLAFCTSDETFWASSQKASCNNGLRDSSTGDLTAGGGTSFDAPIFSALVAIINQVKNSTGQGVVNPTLYSLAATSAYATAFHDITSGGNQCLSGTIYCAAPATTDYAATTGYDEASGLGSIDFFNLLTAWPSSVTGGSPSFALAANGVNIVPGASATGMLTITPLNGFTGTVNLTLTGSITDGCIVLGSNSVALTGATAASSTYTVYTSSSACTAAGAARSGTGLIARSAAKPSPWKHLPLPASSLAGALLLLTLRRSRLRSKFLTASLTLALVASLSFSGLALTGCSGSTATTNNITTTTTNDTPAGTYTLTVTGASGTTTSSATITLTVS